MVSDNQKRHLFTIVHAIDHLDEGVKKTRDELLMAHSDYVVSIMDKIIVAGPMFADDNKTIVGSILIYKTDDKSEAENLLKGDPYYSADIWDKISINTFRAAVGDVVGGRAF